MSWSASFHPKFQAEVLELPKAVRVELIASLELLKEFGPALGRPDVDTLKNSRYANMKEIRFRADRGVGAWHLPSIRGATQYCSSLGTKRA